MVLLIGSVDENLYMTKLPTDKAFLKALGARLREIRLQKGWTLEETEEHGWTNWRHLQKIETGKNITILTLLKVSKLYGMTLSSLLKSLD